MKKLLFGGLFTIVLALSSHADAALTNKGCGLMVDGVCQGNLIYDDVARITWFDYTYKGPCPNVQGYDGATIDEAKQWVAGLNVAGVTNWRLPTMQLPDGCLPANLNDLLNPCVLSNFTCKACQPLSFSVNNIFGYLYWIAFQGTTFWGTDPFTNLDPGAGKYYWTSTALLNQAQLALSFESGQVNIITSSGQRYYAMAVHGGEVNPPALTSVAQVQGSLTDFRTQMKNEKDAALLEDAIQRLANTQKPEFWKPVTIEENQVQYVLNPTTGKVAFHEAQLAVRSLNVLIERGYAVQRFVDEIIYMARWAAQNAISEAEAANTSPQNIAKAKDEMGKATKNALERYGKAWEAATR